MATLHKEIVLPCSASEFWDAARDLGALHTRLVPGFVTDTKLDPSGRSRRVTFANGMQVTEPILSVDSERRRLAWCAEGANTRHYNAVLEVSDCEKGARVVWTTDLLPDEAASAIEAMQDQAFAAMQRAFSGRK
jgi:hypothetical protein